MAGAFKSVNLVLGRSAPSASQVAGAISMLRHWMGGASAPSGQQTAAPISFLRFWMGGAGGSSRGPIPPQPYNPGGGGGDEKQYIRPNNDEILWVLINFTLSQDHAKPN